MKEAMRGKRGPRPGDGGRSKARLVTDCDREVIILATLLTKPGDEPGAAALKLADMLLCDRSDTVDMDMLDVANGRAGAALSNTAGEDTECDESAWCRRSFDPTRRRQWRTRLETLRRKLSTERDAQDIQWFGQSVLALEMLLSPAPAERERAMVLLRCLGWQLTPVVEARLSKWLGQLIGRRRAPETGVARAGNLLTCWSAARCEPGEVLRVEDMFALTPSVKL